MFGKLFGNKVKDSINQFSGNKDFLEALCAACRDIVPLVGEEFTSGDISSTLRGCVEHGRHGIEQVAPGLYRKRPLEAVA